MLVLYDAECGVCRRLVGWLAARDSDGCLAFRPLQESGLLGRLSIDPGAARANVHAVDLSCAHERVTSGAEAAALVISRVSAFGSWRRLMGLPFVVRMVDVGYRALTRRRRMGAGCC